MRHHLRTEGCAPFVQLDLAKLPDSLMPVAPLAELVSSSDVRELVACASPWLRDRLIDAKAYHRDIYRFLSAELKIPRPRASRVLSVHEKAQRVYRGFEELKQSPEYFAFARLIEAIAFAQLTWSGLQPASAD
jgi:hypothetical protein